MLIPFDQLFTRHKIKPKHVLHLGANSGQEASIYAQLGIKQVIWVEALPSLYYKLIAHISPFAGQVGYLACVGDQDGEKVTFNVASNEGQSSSILKFGTHSVEHPTVKFVGEVEMSTIRVDTLLHRNGIILPHEGFLNIDLQGAELKALKGMGSLLAHFRYAYIEVNEKELYQGCPLVGEIDAYLAEFGFVGVECKMTGNGWGDKMYIKS